MPDQPTYSIGVLAQILGVSDATLRKWEDRYPVVVPHRNSAGHRLYSKSQAQQLQFVCDQVATGQARGAAFLLLQDRMAKGIPLAGAKEILPGNPARVLLVDHDPEAANISEYLLRRQRHQVAVASTLDRAIAEIQETTPDLVIIDLLVSGRHGLQMCLQLPQQLGIPVLAISTLNLRAEAIRAGAAGFLLKPIQPQRLATVVQHLLSPRSLITARRAASLTL